MLSLKRNLKTGQFKSVGDPKPHIISLSDKELGIILQLREKQSKHYFAALSQNEFLILKKTRVLKEKFKTLPSADGSYEQDLSFFTKMLGAIASIKSCEMEDCKKQAKFFLLVEKEAFCESCLEKKEYFRI